MRPLPGSPSVCSTPAARVLDPGRVPGCSGGLLSSSCGTTTSSLHPSRRKQDLGSPHDKPPSSVSLYLGPHLLTHIPRVHWPSSHPPSFSLCKAWPHCWQTLPSGPPGTPVSLEVILGRYVFILSPAVQERLSQEGWALSPSWAIGTSSSSLPPSSSPVFFSLPSKLLEKLVTHSSTSSPPIYSLRLTFLKKF